VSAEKTVNEYSTLHIWFPHIPYSSCRHHLRYDVLAHIAGFRRRTQSDPPDSAVIGMIHDECRGRTVGLVAVDWRFIAQRLVLELFYRLHTLRWCTGFGCPIRRKI
jgi:hypothetical protein